MVPATPAPPIDELWQLANFTPNPNQCAAILHTDGPLYLPAGPGSGKTRVLLWRTVNLIVYHGVRPRDIFLSTFTEKAAFQLREGLRSLLSIVTNLTDVNYDLGEMYIGTIHSLCQRLIADRSLRADRKSRPRPPALLDELGQYFDLVDKHNWAALLESASLNPETDNATLNAIFGVSSTSKHRAASNCIAFFNRLAEENINPSTAAIALGSPAKRNQLLNCEVSPEQVETLLMLAMSYNLRLKESRLTTFSLVQQEAYRHTEELVPGCFSHIIIDEYQDTNPIQEMLLFKLAAATTNLCVVGDDDQALYRFRGATVENFVRFPATCTRLLGVAPTIIPLDTNYRSRSPIVDFYKDFIGRCNWYGQNGDGPFRVLDKNIQAFRSDLLPAVVSSQPCKPVDAFAEIAQLVKTLIDTEKVTDPNQIAFLFPGLKYNGKMTDQVQRMKVALEALGLQVYAPRAGRFLEVDESVDFFGILLHIFGSPDRNLEIAGGGYAEYHDWLGAIKTTARTLIDADPQLKRYVETRRSEITQIIADGRALRTVAEARGWQLTDPYDIARMKRALLDARGLSDHTKRGLNSTYFESQVHKRAEEGNPFLLRQVLNRVTASDWSLLDILYQLMGFDHFRAMFDLAESGADEGPICNLSLISNYLGRFVDTYSPIFTSSSLEENRFSNRFFGGYLYALYRLGESEYENADDPFPRGRIPFLTVHQAKGLEFPVVVLANPRKEDRGAGLVEKMVRPFLEREAGEPLDRIAEFDIMRMFYVALSRPQNLLIFGNLHGQGQRMHPHISAMLDPCTTRIRSFDPATVPPARPNDDALPNTYSYTGDFLAYQRCPRQYMIFRKYGFTPSGSQTMMFGSLVHRTLDDLHNFLISQRTQPA